MALGCIFNLYQSYSDRGAFVQKGAWQTTEVEADEIKVGERLPHWPGCETLIVKAFVPGEYIVLDNHGEDVQIAKGEEVQIDSSLFSQEYGVSCYILQCIKMV